MNPTITIITLLVQFVPSSSQINSIQLYYVITEHLLTYPVQSTTRRLKHPSMNQLPNNNMQRDIRNETDSYKCIPVEISYNYMYYCKWKVPIIIH